MNLKKELSRIYKSKDCTDLNDVNNAIEETRVLIRHIELISRPNKAVYSRLSSLEKRKKQLYKKINDKITI